MIIELAANAKLFKSSSVIIGMSTISVPALYQGLNLPFIKGYIGLIEANGDYLVTPAGINFIIK